MFRNSALQLIKVKETVPQDFLTTRFSHAYICIKLYVFPCICIFVCVFMCVYVRVYKRICSRIHVCMYRFPYTYVQVPLSKCIVSRIHIVQVPVCICICSRIQMYIGSRKQIYSGRQKFNSRQKYSMLTFCRRF